MRAWKLIGLGVAGLIIVGGAASVLTSRSAVDPTPVKPAASMPLRPLLTVSEMIAAAEDLNGRCRDSSEDETMTMVACDQRDQMMEALRAEGMCWGNDNDPNEAEYQKTWRPCPSVVAAHPTDLPQEVPSPEIQYEPTRADKAAQIDSAMAATRGCLRAQTTRLALSGMRDREQVAQQITGMCRVILQRTETMSPDEVYAMVLVMAYDAIADVERENGGR